MAFPAIHQRGLARSEASVYSGIHQGEVGSRRCAHISEQLADCSGFGLSPAWNDDAPVSTLELFGRKQDLAFEQPVGNSPRQRHHVRFWRWDQRHAASEVWFGAVTFDERVGLSHTTGQVTHHIGADLDAERDRLIAQLQQAGVTQEVYWLDGFQQLQGKNGGGDPWHTDGRLEVAVLVMPSASPTATNQ